MGNCPCAKEQLNKSCKSLIISNRIITNDNKLQQNLKETNNDKINIDNQSVFDKSLNISYDKDIENFNSLNINPKLSRANKINFDYLISINSEFSASDFVFEINKARQNCKVYSFKIKTLKKKIKFDNKNSENYLMINEKKIILRNDFINFDKSSIYLEDLYNELESKFKILLQLIHIDELKIPFNNDLNINDNNYIALYVEKLKNKYKGVYEIIDYFSLISINDPEIFTFVNCIGENNDNTNNNKKEILKLIFDKDIKYISLNYKTIQDNNCIINILFAK
jgi:hypothetical protein